MSSGLYLGGVQLPFLSSLRVYLPREAYTLTEFAYVEGLLTPGQNGVSIDAAEMGDSLARVSRPTPNPIPTPAGDRVRVLSMGEGLPQLYAPSQIVARSIASAAELLGGTMEQLAAMILPQEEWIRQLEHASQSPHLELPVQTRNSTWGIPFSWFILIYANDRMEVVESNGAILTVRVQVPITTAVGRVERTLHMLAAMAPELDLFDDLEDLGHWLAEFPDTGVVELDYGSVAQRVHPDDSPADVHMGLQCLADGDLGGAAAAYRRLANRWMPVRQQARAS